jgi:hypothetical protein
LASLHVMVLLNGILLLQLSLSFSYFCGVFSSWIFINVLVINFMADLYVFSPPLSTFKPSGSYPSRSGSLVSERVTTPWELGFEAYFGFKYLQQSPTSFWHSQSPFVGPYTVSITVGPHALQGFSSLGTSFTIAGASLHGFTTSIGLQHFHKFCRVSMLLTWRFHGLYNNPGFSTNP